VKRTCLTSISLAAVLLLAVPVFGTSFNEAPMLQELVEQGELPAVEERLPDNPYVVEPIEEIGRYGGTARTGVIGTIEGIGDDTMMMSAWTDFIQADPDGAGYVTHMAESFEPNDEYDVWTLKMREGVKWSDGEPFTADDVMFWYEDVLLNEELTTAINPAWRAGGEVMELVKVDDFTLEFRFAEPKPYFPGQFIHRRWGAVYPRHYMEQFHIDYADAEELAEKVGEAGFEYWHELFSYMSDTIINVPIRVDLPTLAPYRLVSLASDLRIYERNPYFWKVDTEGNQLPYIDRIEAELVADDEVYHGRAISGELDFAAFSTEIQNYPLYRRFEEEYGYRTILWQSGHGNEVIYFPALTHQEERMREVFQNLDFRKALSLGIDRQEINDIVYFGQARPMQYTVMEGSKHYQPEFAESYVEYDPERANALLDEMGMQERDGDGWRLHPDGETFRFAIEYQHAETDKRPNVELVVQYWQELGLDVRMEEISGELIWQRGPANLLDMTVWHGSAETDLLFPAENNFIIPVGTYAANVNFMEWASYYLSDGEMGEEPPEKVAQLLDWYEQVIVEPDPEVRAELAANILQSQAENLWAIGTIGEAPYPIIATNNLRNIPEQGLWGWETQWTTNHDPEQMFFDE